MTTQSVPPENTPSEFDLVCILDRSGSMAGSVSEVIDSYNEFISSQRAETTKTGTKTNVTLILFDDVVEVVHEKIDIFCVPELTDDVYFTRGATALYDAIGTSVATSKPEGNSIFFVQTDGMENRSKEYNSVMISALISETTNAGNEFIFMGADLSNATSMAQSINISANMSVNISKHNLKHGYSSVMDTSATTFRNTKMSGDYSKDAVSASVQEAAKDA